MQTQMKDNIIKRWKHIGDTSICDSTLADEINMRHMLNDKGIFFSVIMFGMFGINTITSMVTQHKITLYTEISFLTWTGDATPLYRINDIKSSQKADPKYDMMDNMAATWHVILSRHLVENKAKDPR